MGGQRDVADAPPIEAYDVDASLTNFEGMGAKLLPLTLVPGAATLPTAARRTHPLRRRRGVLVPYDGGAAYSSSSDSIRPQTSAICSASGRNVTRKWSR